MPRKKTVHLSDRMKEREMELLLKRVPEHLCLRQLIHGIGCPQDTTGLLPVCDRTTTGMWSYHSNVTVTCTYTSILFILSQVLTGARQVAARTLLSPPRFGSRNPFDRL